MAELAELKEPLSPTTEPSKSKEELFLKASVWVVDDNMIAGDFAKGALKSFGYQKVSFFNSSQQALNEYQEAVREGKKLPDLVVSDFNMKSELNGDELYREMKSFSGDEVPIFIIVSGMISELERERVTKLGVFSVLLKPFNLEELEKIVGKGLESHFKKEQET
ncbi:MAG TPA: response regulator [Nevskiaceae bacterium]|nr:response regulator [Nevskiaceae bacterium]